MPTLIKFDGEPIMKKSLLGILFLVGVSTSSFAETWADVDQYVPVRQKAFCNLMDQYEQKAQKALTSKNQIRQNQVDLDRGQDLLALMPAGEFNNWLVKLDEVYVVANGDAAYSMALQCGVTIGSGKVSETDSYVTTKSAEEYVATAAKGSVIYNQLAGLTAGDFVLVSGNLVKFKEKNSTDLGSVFRTQLTGASATINNDRYNSLIKYFADVKTLAKFTSP